jgi:hypothetical protein
MTARPRTCDPLNGKTRPGWLDRGPGGAHVSIQQGDATEGSIGREVLSPVLVEALLSAEAMHNKMHNNLLCTSRPQ